MKALLVTLGSLVTVLTILAVVFVVGMRRKSPLVLTAVRKSGRAMKPLILKSAGTKGNANSVVRHLGRKSGRSYETPVVAVRTDDGFVIALPYGLASDWARNVLANGSASILHDGEQTEVTEPELVTIDEANPYFSAKEQRMHSTFNVQQAMRLRTVDTPLAAAS